MTSVTPVKEGKRCLAGKERRVFCRGWSLVRACRSVGVASTGPDVRQRYTKGSFETDQPEVIMRPASIWNAAGFFVGRRCGGFL